MTLTSPAKDLPPSPPNGSPPPRTLCPTMLIGNKNDLEHLRAVERMEGLSTALQYGTNFYELSVAENSPEVYNTFHTLISTVQQSSSFCQQQPKRKFSMSKMLGNLRLGRNSPCNSASSMLTISGQASVIDLDRSQRAGSCASLSDCGKSFRTRCDSPIRRIVGASCTKSHQRHSSDAGSSASSSHIGSSLCSLRSKLAEFHAVKKRQPLPPVCSL